jgi:hypothetical protein
MTTEFDWHDGAGNSVTQHAVATRCRNESGKEGLYLLPFDGEECQ